MKTPQRLRPLVLLVAALLLLATGRAQAISTDINTFSANAAAPNIMILLDTSKSMQWDSAGCAACPKKKWEMARDAIRDIILSVNPPDGSGAGYVENVRFGLFQFDRTNWGGLLKVPIAPGNTASILSVLDAYAIGSNAGGTPNGSSLTDVGRYFAGTDGWGTLPLYGTLPVRLPVTSWPPPSGQIEPPAPSPIVDDCRSNVIINLSDGEADPVDMGKYVPWQDNGTQWCFPVGTCPADPTLSDATQFCATIGDADADGVETCGLQCGFDAANRPMMGEDCPSPPLRNDWGFLDWIDDVAYAMNRYDFAPGIPGMQNITVHNIAYDLTGAGRDSLIAASANGGGLFFDATDYQTLYDALAQLTATTMEGNFSFAAPSVTAFQTALTDGFFVASFDPSGDEAFWAGHLQAFRISTQLVILDKNQNPALDPNSGLFNDPPNPFWDAGVELAKSSHPTRKLYTTKYVPTALREDFATNKVSAADLALTNADLVLYPNYPTISFANTNALRDGLIDFIWGQDTFDADADGDTGELRNAVLGDIFHSGAIQIGPPSSFLIGEDGFGPPNDPLSFWATHQYRDRKLMVGANDGMLHAFNAGSFNVGDNPATPETENGYYDLGTGEEDFGYIPSFLTDTLKYIPINNPRQYYYVDGSPSAADIWIPKNGADTSKEPTEWATALVVGMKDGDSGYLALDVSDPGDSKYPELLWELDETDIPIGNTWSEAVITRVKLKTGSADFCGKITTDDGPCREQWVAIFGGGYRQDGDPGLAAYVSDPGSASWSDASKGIFMVAMDTGELIGQVVYDANPTETLNQMRFSIPSSPAVLDLDFDGFADVVYVGDLGGQMWRWDISKVGEDTALSDGLMDNWPVGLLFKSDPATLGAGGTHHHSIFFPPVATYLNGELVLAFGSGERTNLGYIGDAADDDNNRFWVVWDRTPLGLDPEDPLTNWVTIGEGHTLVGSVTRGLNDVSNLATDPDPFDDGYFIKAPEGEKFITNHVLFAGILITLAYDPAGAGAPLGPCGGVSSGASNVWVFNLGNAGGLLDSAAAAGNDQRKLYVGPGVPGDPRITISKDKVQIVGRTSTGALIQLDIPADPPPPIELVFWRQLY